MAKQFSGDRLRHYRRLAGLRQEQVAAAVDRSLRQVWAYETGESRPPTNMVGRLAEVVGVDPADLFAEPGTAA